LSGESGLDGVTLLPQPIEPAVTGVDYLEAMYKALISTPRDTAWLVSTGTLTNIGLLFQKYPDLAGHLKGVSIMGGAVGGGFTNAPMGKVKGEGERFGNWTAYAEFNVSIEHVQDTHQTNITVDLCTNNHSLYNDLTDDNSATPKPHTSSSRIPSSSPRPR
jgi:inosine-uridine nucleoside N-ribohydrolase